MVNNRFFLKFFPRSLFGRMLLSMIGLSLILIGCSSVLFYFKVYRLLDQEANQRLLEGALSLSRELGRLPTETATETAAILLRERFGGPQNFGWIQNAYWVDLRGKKTDFLASYSLSSEKFSTLHPPSPEDIDDMMDDGMIPLEEGRPYFPDPFSLGDERRFKIALIPILDSDGLVSSVVGLEADMQYLDMYNSVQSSFFSLLGFSLTAGIIISLLLARSFSRKLGDLLQDLDSIAEQKKPSGKNPGIYELETLKQGLIELGEKIQNRNRQLEAVHSEKLKELSLFGSALAHEIRNPLGAMELHLGLIRRRFKPEEADQEAFNEIHSQMNLVKSLIERFLNYSKKVSPKKALCRPYSIMQELVAIKHKTASDFEVKMNPETDFEICFDPGMLRVILENLLNNSIEARSNGLVVSFEGKKTREMVQLSFFDNGPGILSDFSDRLFTPFATTKPSGHGIGLALVRKLVEAHNGTISFFKPENGGAGFLIDVPEN